MADGVTAGRWAPGQSGNPRGRPKKGDSVAEIIRKLGGKRMAYTGDDGKLTRKKRVEVLVLDLWDIALDKAVDIDARLRAADMLMDRRDGKPRQAMQHELTQVPELVIRYAPPEPAPEKPGA